VSSNDHIPIMVSELLTAFEPVQIKVFYDGTLGAGGHAAQILEAHPEIERYIGVDRDTGALAIAKKTLKPWSGKVDFVHGNFSDLDSHLTERGIDAVDGFFLT